MITEAEQIVEFPSTKANHVPKFTFGAVDAKFAGFKEIQPNLFRWGMQENTWVSKFSFDQYFQPYEINDFLLNFFNDPSVRCSLKVLGLNGTWGTMGKVKSLQIEDTAHTITSLSFFDRLYANGCYIYDSFY